MYKRSTVPSVVREVSAILVDPTIQPPLPDDCRFEDTVSPTRPERRTQQNDDRWADRGRAVEVLGCNPNRSTGVCDFLFSFKEEEYVSQDVSTFLFFVVLTNRPEGGSDVVWFG